MIKVEVYSWIPGFLSITQTQILQKYTDWGLTKRRDETHKVLNGSGFIIELPSKEIADQFIKETTENNALARIL